LRSDIEGTETTIVIESIAFLGFDRETTPLVGSLCQHFTLKGTSPTNHPWPEEPRDIDLLCGIGIRTEGSKFSHSPRFYSDRISMTKTALCVAGTR